MNEQSKEESLSSFPNNRRKTSSTSKVISSSSRKQLPSSSATKQHSFTNDIINYDDATREPSFITNKKSLSSHNIVEETQQSRNVPRENSYNSEDNILFTNKKYNGPNRTIVPNNNDISPIQVITMKTNTSYRVQNTTITTITNKNKNNKEVIDKGRRNKTTVPNDTNDMSPIKAIKMKTNSSHRVRNNNNNNNEESVDNDNSSMDLSEYIEEAYVKENDELDQRFIPPLIMHAYHLPGYTYWQDWKQYMFNNHPILGICFHHPRHPIQGWTRIATMFGSILFGLFITNVIYLAFVFTNSDYNKTYVEPDALISNGLHETLNDYNNVKSIITISNGNIALWTLGVTIHAIYDNVIWSLAACVCFMDPGMKVSDKMKRYKRTGSFLVTLCVIFVAALATFVVTIRAALDNDGDGEVVTNDVRAVKNIQDITSVYKQQQQSNNTDDIAANTNTTMSAAVVQHQPGQQNTNHSYQFVTAYFIELALTYFIFYPVIGTILFSGILTCGRFPVLGGRPYEVKQEDDEKLNATLEEECDEKNVDCQNQVVEKANLQQQQQQQQFRKGGLQRNVTKHERTDPTREFVVDRQVSYEYIEHGQGISQRTRMSSEASV